MSFQYLLIAIGASLNIMSFLVMAYDKRRSRRGSDTERVPEGVLFCVAATGGALGLYVGMLSFRHKIRKWYFQLGIPLIMVQNLATFFWLRELWM